MGTRLTEAFSRYGFCTAIRGAEGGGKVDDLPQHIFQSDDGDMDAKCPTEIGITDRREYELSNLGFLPLCHYKNHDYAVFFGAQTAQKAKEYDRAEATANAKISARLPYIMATSRFAHYLKVMARDKIGSFMEAEDCERWLNRWIKNYVNTNENAGAESKAMFPLREARVEVREIPGRPGAYNAIAYMRPWLQMEAADGRADDQSAHGRTHSGKGLTCRSCPGRASGSGASRPRCASKRWPGGSSVQKGRRSRNASRFSFVRIAGRWPSGSGRRSRPKWRGIRTDAARCWTGTSRRSTPSLPISSTRCCIIRASNGSRDPGAAWPG
ncbi:MAG: type VI secretion system contractile sheath large subunit [Aliidongia sp.]